MSLARKKKTQRTFPPICDRLHNTWLTEGVEECGTNGRDTPRIFLFHISHVHAALYAEPLALNLYDTNFYHTLIVTSPQPQKKKKKNSLSPHVELANQ